MSITGERMQARRKELRISADTLAEYLGVSRSTIFRYENGDIEKVPANLLPDIAKFLKTSEAFLMGWEDNSKTTKVSPQIMQYYNKLNKTGKQEATKRVEELTNLPQYITEDTPDYLIVQAAHADPNITDEELENMKEDIEKLKRPD